MKSLCLISRNILFSAVSSPFCPFSVHYGTNLRTDVFVCACGSVDAYASLCAHDYVSLLVTCLRVCVCGPFEGH